MASEGRWLLPWVFLINAEGHGGPVMGSGAGVGRETRAVPSPWGGGGWSRELLAHFCAHYKIIYYPKPL